MGNCCANIFQVQASATSREHLPPAGIHSSHHNPGSELHHQEDDQILTSLPTRLSAPPTTQHSQHEHLHNRSSSHRNSNSDHSTTSQQNTRNRVYIDSQQGRGSDATGQKQDDDGDGDGVNWQQVVSRAKARGNVECPICIGRLSRRGDAGE